MKTLTPSTPREFLAWSGRWLLMLGLGLAGRMSQAAAATSFELPPQCGDREQFDHAIRTRVGDEAPLLMQDFALSIAPYGTLYRLNLRVGKDLRQLEDKSCTDLFRAAVVVAVALWEAPRATPSGSETQPSVPKTPDPALAAVPMAGATAPMDRSPTAFSGWTISGEVGAMVGLQPKWGPSLGLRAARDWQSWGLSIRLRGRPATAQEDQSRHGVSVIGFGTDASAFLKPSDAVMVELGVALFALRATGLGSRSNWTTTRFSVGPRLGVGVVPWRFGSLFLAVGIEGQLLLLRPRFEILEYGEVFQVGRLAGAAHLGAGFRFR